MTFQFHPAAKDEFIATALYYAAVRTGLGEQFRAAVQDTLNHIVTHPEIGGTRGAARRLRVSGFPYDLVYRVTTSTIDVLAVAHHRRRPGYWRRRK